MPPFRTSWLYLVPPFTVQIYELFPKLASLFEIFLGLGLKTIDGEDLSPYINIQLSDGPGGRYNYYGYDSSVYGLMPLQVPDSH